MADTTDEQKPVENEEEEKKGEEETPDPSVRKSAAFFAQRRIIKKQEREIARVKEDEEDENAEEAEPQQETRKLIEEHLQPIVETLKSQVDEAELREHLAGHPEHKKFEGAARKRMIAWPNVPVSEIFKTITFGTSDASKQEAKAKAEEKARKAALGGSSARAEEGGLPTTQKEMEDAYKRVKRGETIKLG